MEIRKFLIADDGRFPNNGRLPLLLYVGALDLSGGSDPAAAIEELFRSHRWGRGWRNGVYAFQHYHSTAHEALGAFRGGAKVQFGGDSGSVVSMVRGDVVVIPAGVAHKCLEASPDFSVVAAYPPGQSPDLCLGKAGERPRADENIARVAVPDQDPVEGPTGTLPAVWGSRTAPPR
jgi:uncharacterized protein YjlB